MRCIAGRTLTGLLLVQLSVALPSTMDRLAWPWREHYIEKAPNLDFIQPSVRLESRNQQEGAVASESAVCSQVGIDIFKRGGNAADSMVATTLCVGVIASYHSGIGGGGFMLIRSKNGSYEFVDFRETAPLKAWKDMYKNNTEASIYGGLASGVPGEIRGLAYLHERYGNLAWSDVVKPAARIANHGFTATEDLLRFMNAAIARRGDNFFVNDPSWAIDFSNYGVLPQVGQTITRKRYARTLERIANYGPDAFYKGKIADSMAETIKEHHGVITREDLREYKIAVREVSEIEYKDFRIRSGSAPSSGAVVLSALNIIGGYEDIGQASSLNISTHRFDEALRFAYGQRTVLGDPLYVEGMRKYEEEMVDPATAAAVRARIDDYQTHNVSFYDPEGFESLDTPGTSGIVTSDRSGLAITLTTTVNLPFGSLVMDMKTGIIMNNEMNDFSIPGSSNAFGYIPCPNNYIAPGKRPLSSIVPTIIEHKNGTLYYLIAAAGGSRIITATLQNIWNVVDRNMTAKQANAEPRLHDQLVPNLVTFEYAYDNDTVAYMKSRKHNVTFVAPGLSAAHSIRLLSNGSFEAASEPRQKHSGGLAW